MTRTPRRMQPERIFTIVLLAGVLQASPALADAYGDARADLIAAYQARDYPRMREAAHAALDARPGYPGALFNLALADVLAGDAVASLKIMRSLAARGVDYAIEDAEEFVPLRTLSGWSDFRRSIGELREPVGEATVAYSFDEGDFVPEGIAIGPAGELYLGSIRHGTIVRIDGGVRRIGDPAGGHWSVFGMRLDTHGGLWFASAAVPEFAGASEADAGRTGLFYLEPETRAVSVRALLPDDGQARVLGDLVIADADTIYATESLTGALYRYSIAAGRFTELLGPGALRSMQGLVVDRGGHHLYVADYVGGLFRVSLEDLTIERVRSPDSICLFGIDGLYRHGAELIAVQNGIKPNRVVALTLSGDGLAVEASRVLARNLPQFDEPSLGALAGDDFYFVANSHWNRFGPDASLPDGLTGPIVLKVGLGGSATAGGPVNR
jgi:streptogramin lyase